MAYEQRDNSGAMFVNERKTTSSHPDRNGSCMINGVEYWVSGWVKEPKTAGKQKWLSLSFTPKESNQSSRSEPKPAGGFDNMDDDIPF